MCGIAGIVGPGAEAELPLVGRMMQLLAQHFRRDQGNAVLGHQKALGVFLEIFADHHAFRDLTALVDHGPLQATMSSDGHVGQHHRVFNFAKRMYFDVGK